MPPREATRSSSKISRGFSNGKYWPRPRRCARSQMISRIPPRIAGRIDGLLHVDHAPFGAAADALFFFLQAAGQNDVGVVRGFRQEEIDHAEELQLLQRLAREVRIGQRDQRIEADRKQPFDFAAVDRVHDFLRRCSPAAESRRA